MSIEQHPIPQDVAGYKFRLIGDMTVKQFIWLAGGIILGLFTYSLPFLPFFFKYPLVAIFVGLGAGIAFLPVEGRPMDKWLIAFIKSVYSPTQYTWQKGASENELSSPTMTPKSPLISPQVSVPVPPVVQPSPVVPTPINTESPVVSNPQMSNIKSQISNIPSDNLPIPYTPTSPNTLVGMTLTPDGKTLAGCLIEIKRNSESFRATRSNQLGQFMFAKPLENGVYQILTEKPGYTFDTYSLTLTGQIIKPLRLQAKSI